MISACISYLVFPLLSAHSLVMRRCTFILDAMQVQHLNLQLKVWKSSRELTVMLMYSGASIFSARHRILCITRRCIWVFAVWSLLHLMYCIAFSYGYGCEIVCKSRVTSQWVDLQWHRLQSIYTYDGRIVWFFWFHRHPCWSCWSYILEPTAFSVGLC